MANDFRRSLLRLTWLLVGMLMLCSTAGAQSTRKHPDERAEVDSEYDTLIKKAIAEFQRGNWPEARVYFQRAHVLLPSARTLRGLGLTAYELRSYVEASGLLQQALDARERALTGAVRDEVGRTLNEAKSFVSMRKLTLEPASASLRVDEEPAVIRDGALWLDPGNHELLVEAQGYQPLTRSLSAKSGVGSELTLRLAPLTPPLQTRAPRADPDEPRSSADTPEDTRDPFGATPLAKPKPKPSRESDEGMPVQQILGITAGAAGVVGIGLSVTFAVLAGNANHASRANCEGNRCNEIGFQDRDTAFSRAGISTVAAISGAVLLAGGAVLFLTAPSAPAEKERVQVVPHVSPDRAGLVVSGRF